MHPTVGAASVRISYPLQLKRALVVGIALVISAAMRFRGAPDVDLKRRLESDQTSAHFCFQGDTSGDTSLFFASRMAPVDPATCATQRFNLVGPAQHPMQGDATKEKLGRPGTFLNKKRPKH